MSDRERTQWGWCPRLAAALGVGAALLAAGVLAQRQGHSGLNIDEETGAVYRLQEAQFSADTQALQSGYGRDVLLALQSRYYEIETERARLPGREGDPVDRIALGWRDLDRSSASADVLGARRHFEAAARADPNSVEAALGVGSTYLVEFHGYYSAAPQAALDGAERALKRALGLAPDNPRVLSAWADVLLLRGRPDDAFWVWRRALEIAPESPGAQLRLASALVRQGRYEEAEGRLALLADLRPYQVRRQQVLSQTLAEAAFAQGRDDEAYRILKHWAAEFPASGMPHAPDQNGAAGTRGFGPFNSTADEAKVQADAIQQAHAPDQNGAAGTRGFGDYQGMKDPARVAAEAVDTANAPDQNVAGGSKVDSKVVSTMPAHPATTASK